MSGPARHALFVAGRRGTPCLLRGNAILTPILSYIRPACTLPPKSTVPCADTEMSCLGSAWRIGLLCLVAPCYAWLTSCQAARVLLMAPLPRATDAHRIFNNATSSGDNLCTAFTQM